MKKARAASAVRASSSQRCRGGFVGGVVVGGGLVVPVVVPVPVPVVVPVPVPPVPVGVVAGHASVEGSQFAGLGEPLVFGLWHPAANTTAAIIGTIARI
jgi:hypothetical protein